MTRDQAIATLRAGLSTLPHGGEARADAFTALIHLLAELETAEELLDDGYEGLVSTLPERKPTIDRIVFSRRVTRRV